ncbi:hypothetical protein MLD38_017432 [Melastoma candidum]|uniref:Uncharacterized protein n=2 Tax=Melastoma candidum TaxID=119954 RepID=A0ACB9QTQ8_9MYRT|nr:hypothetical protein MLD38_017432 [Melastoma candidum]
MPEVEPGRRGGSSLFGKYEIGRVLGCGAFAKVYHARNLHTGQSVALKVIQKKRLASSSALLSNVKREISILRLLDHPHIVRLHEVLATRTKIYFVMELVKGGELFARVAKGRLSEDVSRGLFRQLISAVGYCHSRGIFHRDLKPENLLVDDSGNLKVTDFGLSALGAQVRSDGLLHTLCGTPAYVAPEILAKRGYDGAKVDLWSCGVILFVLNAGYLPFNDPNLMALYRKIYNGEFRCPKWMSPELKRLINRLLDTNPDTRITVHEIYRDPWFNKGHTKRPEDASTSGVGIRSSLKHEEGEETGILNAFNIISFSRGLSLTGLLDETYDVAEDEERFICRESPERVMEALEELGKGEGLKVTRMKKEWGAEVEGRNSDLRMEVVVNRLTDTIGIVEARRVGGDAATYREFWKNKLRPRLRQVR